MRAVPLSGLAVEIAAVGAKRQEPLRNPARSGRTRPHRCPHRRRPPRPRDVASDGRKAGNAVDAAPGRRRSCSARSTMPGSRPATAACSSACATSLHPGQNDGNRIRSQRTSPDRQPRKTAFPPSSRDAPMAACSVRAAASISGSEESTMAVDATMPTTIVSAPGDRHTRQAPTPPRRRRPGSRIISRPS